MHQKGRMVPSGRVSCLDDHNLRVFCGVSAWCHYSQWVQSQDRVLQKAAPLGCMLWRPLCQHMQQVFLKCCQNCFGRPVRHLKFWYDPSFYVSNGCGT